MSLPGETQDTSGAARLRLRRANGGIAVRVRDADAKTIGMGFWAVAIRVCNQCMDQNERP